MARWLSRKIAPACAARLALTLCLLPARPADAVEDVLFRYDGREQRISGRVLTTAVDGGLLVEGRDGSLWTVTPADLLERRSDDEPFEPFSQQELTSQLLETLPDGFNVHRTAHYLVCYDTSKAYAMWVGSLFERLYTAFTNYWKNRDFELDTARFPLVALVFADRQDYLRHARPEVGAAVEGIIGYYSLRTNRITTYDLTGVEALRGGNDSKRGSVAEINRMLDRPQAEQAVSTVIHEATHQIAFNTGFQVRYADTPLWVNEGIAVYFETPDLKSKSGWRNIGGVNYKRLEQFHDYRLRRNKGSLASLVSGDDRFRDREHGLDAYAEAWALNYFLLRQRSGQYHAYLKRLAAKPQLIFGEPADRLAEFKDAFGNDLSDLDADFLRYIDKVK